MSTNHNGNNVTSCSSTPPGVSDQATGSCTVSCVNDQTTSMSLTPPPDVSAEAVNFSRQTSKKASVQHDVGGEEMREYLRIVSADKYADYLHVIDNNDAEYLHAIDNDADYLHVIDNSVDYLHVVDNDADYLHAIDNDADYLHAIDNDADYLHAIDNDADYLHAIDNDADYLHVIDNDADYLHVIDSDADYLHAVADNLATVNDETGYLRLDNVQSHSKPGCQQQCYHPLIKDIHAYQGIVDVELNYEQVVDLDHNYDHSSYNEPDQAQATSTSEASFSTTTDMHELQQVAVYGTSHNDDLTGLNNRAKQRLSILLFLAASVGVLLLACSVVIIIIIVVNPTLLRVHVDEADWPPQQPANAIEAFGIMRTQQHQRIVNRLLEFDSVIRNVTSTSVDLTSSSFTAPQTPSPRLYWMIIAIEVPTQTPAHVQLANTSLIISKSHSKNSEKDIVTKSGVVQLEPANVVTVQSDYAVNTAYWSGLCLNNIMQSVVAIFVASSKQLTSTVPNGSTKIVYDTVVINEGKAWDTNNDVFVVPQSGIYVFSISIGFTSPHNPVAVLGVSTGTDRQELMIGQAGMGEMISSDVDFVSTSCVLHLVERATVEGMFFRAKSTYSDTATLATSLSAFLYSPADNNKVVWSVAMTTGSYTVPTNEKPLFYDSVRLNIGGAWLPSQNTVVIPTPGIYYVFIVFDVCDNSRGTLWLQVNKTRIFEIKSTTSPNLVQTRSNGAVIRLATGNELTVEVADVSISCFHGSNLGINSFMGLLLTPASD